MIAVLPAMVALVIAVFVVPQPSAQSLRARPAGVIRGIVLSAADNRPLRMAHVVLIGAATGTVRMTASDADGRFVFAQLPADRYTIGASKPPYLGAVAGARRPARPGSPVALADGETISDVAIRLFRGASISGAIADERGQPAVSAAVELQQWRLENGERVLVQAGGPVRTDDQGRYRIHGLTPGEYIVVISQVGRLVPPLAFSDADVDETLKTGRRPDLPDQSMRYAPVFYPGTVRVADAQPVILTPGEERQGIDFRMQLVRTSRIQGTVLAPDGQPVAQPMVRLLSASSNSRPLGAFAMMSSAAPAGRFTISGVVPGTHLVVATGRGPLADHVASEVIEVAGEDRSDIELTLRPPVTLTARLVFDGTGAPPLAGHRLPLRSLSPGSSAVGPIVTPTKDDGVFTITRVTPGSYVIGGPMFFGATTASVTWALTSVVVDGKDVTDLPFDIAVDAPPPDIVVTYGDQWQEISGRLQQRSGAPAPGYVVIAFPAEPAYWMSGSRRIVTARSGTTGQFTLGGPGPSTLPPGDYLLAVVPDLDRDEPFERAFLSTLVSSAVPVTLQPGERKVQNLGIR